jgi:RHS repeat-associated protein
VYWDGSRIDEIGQRRGPPEEPCLRHGEGGDTSPLKGCCTATLVAVKLGHFPFGESWYNASGDKLLFTSYERDSESGNDYAVARFNVNRLGRFSAVDPLNGSIADPHSLNHYIYVEDQPINQVDPSGKGRCFIPRYWKEFSMGDCGGGGSPSEGDILSFFTAGTDIFDALRGVPGTYISYDIHGNMSSGFSPDLYKFIGGIAGVDGLSVDGWTYTIQDLGADKIASGFLADTIAHMEEAAWLNANYPGSVDQITSDINHALATLARLGLNMNSIYMPKIISEVLDNFAQQNSLGDDWVTFFYNYFVRVGPALPKNPNP